MEVGVQLALVDEGMKRSRGQSYTKKQTGLFLLLSKMEDILPYLYAKDWNYQKGKE